MLQIEQRDWLKSFVFMTICFLFGIELFLFLRQYSKEENSKQNQEESCNKNSHNELGNLDVTIRFFIYLLQSTIFSNNIILY